MRFLIALLLVAGCAHQQTADTPPTAPSLPPLSAAELRACQSCQQGLDQCQRTNAGRASSGGDTSATCMDQMILCLRAQSLEPGRCAGLN